MIQKINFAIEELYQMQKYPNELYYIGNTSLLKMKKISIIGTRRPSSYTKEFTHKLSLELTKAGVCIVSGAAMGVDAIAHKATNINNTIAVVANGLDIKYPSINRNLIKDIEQKGLVLSAYKEGTKARKYSFVHRNEIVVALGDILIVTEADLNSGSLTSVNYALKMNKEIYTLPHRIKESLGTQKLIEEGKIKPIYDIDKFVKNITGINNKSSIENDEILEFCKNNPLYDEAVLKFQDKIFEYELEGKITITNGKIVIN